MRLVPLTQRPVQALSIPVLVQLGRHLDASQYYESLTWMSRTNNHQEQTKAMLRDRESTLQVRSGQRTGWWTDSGWPPATLSAVSSGSLSGLWFASVWAEWLILWGHGQQRLGWL